MSATWGDDPKPPIVIHISVAQKAAIVARTPRMLITFDLASGDFSIRPMEYIRFRVIQHPDLIHPRELTDADDAVGQRSDDPT